MAFFSLEDQANALGKPGSNDGLRGNMFAPAQSDGLTLANRPDPFGGQGNGLTTTVGGGISYSPTNFNGQKLADALKNFGASKTVMPMGDAGYVHNRQQDYQQYLNAFNAQNKG